MTSSKPYASAYKKLDRAMHHIDSLDAAIESFFKTNWYKCSFGKSADDNYHLEVDVYGSPAEFGLIVGDAVHNLRSALDLLAVEAVRLNGGNTRNVYFPFSDRAENIESAIRGRKFHRASITDCDRIRAFVVA